MADKKRGVSLWLTTQLEREYGAYVGVDEVGLGCFAGPIYAAAVVILNYDWPEIDQLGDSKAIGPRKRTFLAARIKEECKWAIGQATSQEIDELGIRVAHAKSIERAVSGLRRKHVPTPVVVIDGDAFDIDLGTLPVRFIRHGDSIIPAISAASIIAKVDRDAYMTELSKKYPEYGWDRNAAYGSPEHKAAMLEHGLTPYHRRSFKPVGRVAHELGDCCDGTKAACCFMHAAKPSHGRGR